MMNHHNNIPFNLLAIPKAAPPVYKQQPPPGRIPEDFREAMIHVPVKLAVNANVRTSGMTANTQKKPAVQPSAGKWKSSFKPLDKQEDSADASDCCSERAEIYNPYDPVSSDSDQEMQRVQDHDQSPPDQDNTLGLQRLSPMQPSAGKWTSLLKPLGEPEDSADTSNCRSERWPLDVKVKKARKMQYDPVSSDSEQEMVHIHNQFSPDQDNNNNNNLGRQRLSLSSSCSKKRRWGSNYSESVSQPLDSHDLSPETRPTESRGLSPGQTLPEQHRAYEGQRTNGEEEIIPEYLREMTTTVRLSPSRLQRDYQHQLEYVGTGLDQITRFTEVPRNRSINIIMSPISCDLCDVELASGRELEDHLESKSHWDTLEHIQQQNDYDDLAIAFLQEVMLYKSHQCSRAIEDSALQALQENDHMTKTEMFHCAACSVFISTSASSVQAHITSQEHLSNTKEFQVQQRRSSLDKAETMMKMLKPQFEHFLKGGRPFE